ncbi:ArnT family glycosyltransferase [Aquabacterium sp.]|uniref:ArnT family glycosyltransferase n=1 Tax=Aquabacterium sp. TaxID=1872578 RepID=UPI00378434AA
MTAAVAGASQSAAVRREAWRIGLLVFAWLAFTAWARPLMLPDEGRYAGVAWEMMRSQDWLTPTLNGLPFFHKPPLFYWITAASMSLLGPGQWSARTASLLGATLGAMALYLFTRRWYGERPARSALLVLLVQPMWFLGGQFANLDMLVAGCIVACTLALAHAALLVEAARPHRASLLAAYALAALGVLAKGLIGFVIPALIVTAWLLLRRRWGSVWRLLSLPGALLFLAIAGPWFYAMATRFEGFLHYFFVVQHFQRFAAGGFNNVQPFWFYPAVLALFSLPWLPWWRAPLPASDQAPAPAQRAGVLLMQVALATVLLFFSLPQSKLLGYILPAVPPLAWLLARHRPAPQATLRAQRWWWATVAFTACVGLVAVGALALDRKHSARALGQALAAARQPGEPVLMLGLYLYDVPLYARLTEPVMVMDDWTDPDVTQRDSWRKELWDAGQFAPARAARLLVGADAARAALCHAPVAWVIGWTPAGNGPGLPRWMGQATAIRQGHAQTLWRVTPAPCAQTPNGG